MTTEKTGTPAAPAAPVSLAAPAVIECEVLPPIEADHQLEVITGLKTSTTDDPNMPAMSTRTLPGGVKETVINPQRFIDSVFYGLEITHGVYKGEKITPQLIKEVEDTGVELLALTLDEMFMGDNAAKCESFRADVTSRVQSPVNTKAGELKGPINKFKGIILDLPRQALGRIPEIHEAMLAKNKQYNAEKEKREREAAQKDATWQEKTTKKLIEVSGLAGTLASSPSGAVQNALDILGSDDFEPHENFADQYADAVAGAKNTLGVMLESKIKAEAEAKEKAEAEKKAQAERDAELKKLQAEKADQKLKDDANQALMGIAVLYAEAVGGNSSTLDEANKKIDDLASSMVKINDLISSLEANDYFDKEKAGDYLNRTSLELEATVKREKEAAEALAKEKAAAKKEEAERVKQEKKELLKLNRDLLLDAGYEELPGEDGKAYQKSGKTIFIENQLSEVSSDHVRYQIAVTDKAIANEAEEAKAKEEAERKERAEKEAAEEKAQQEYAANLESAKEDMSQAILSLGTHEEIIAAIVEGTIPHVRFEIEVRN